MKRALNLMILLCLAVPTLTGQQPAKVTPKTYKVAQVDNSGSVSLDGRFLMYADWDTDEVPGNVVGVGARSDACTVTCSRECIERCHENACNKVMWQRHARVRIREERSPIRRTYV